jgi:hypothetical protein
VLYVLSFVDDAVFCAGSLGVHKVSGECNISKLTSFFELSGLKEKGS